MAEEYSGLVMIEEVRVRQQRRYIARAAFTPTGTETRAVDTWTVGTMTLPEGTAPVTVASHAAACVPFGAGHRLVIPSLDAETVWREMRNARDDHGHRLWTVCGPCAARLFSVRTEEQTYALFLKGDVPALIKAVRDDALEKRLADAVKAEQTPEHADDARALYLECVAQALRDPAVMSPLFDATQTAPYEAIRRAFMERPYVTDALAQIRRWR